MKYKQIQFSIDQNPNVVHNYIKHEPSEVIEYKSIKNPFFDKVQSTQFVYYHSQNRNTLRLQKKQITWMHHAIIADISTYVPKTKRKKVRLKKKSVNFQKAIFDGLKIKRYKVKVAMKKIKSAKYVERPMYDYYRVKEIAKSLDVIDNPIEKAQIPKATILVNMNNCAKYTDQLFELRKHFNIIEDFSNDDIYYNINNTFVLYKRGAVKRPKNGIVVDKIRNELSFEFIISKIRS